MKRKINLRLAGIAILAILVTAISITIIYYNLFQKQILSELSVTVNVLKDTGYFESTSIDINKINLSADAKDFRITWIDKNGNVLYDNTIEASKLENHKDRLEVKEAFEKGNGLSVRKSDTMNKDLCYYAILLDNGTVLRVASYVQSLWSMFLSVSPIILLIITCIIIICLVISNFLTKQLIKPIEVMAENIENEDYESPYKELDPLAFKLRSQHVDVLQAAKVRQDFTANVSHELKTPLTAISGYAELLESGMVDKEQQKHFYQEIRKNSNRLLSLINDIIRLSELDNEKLKMNFEDIDLDEIILECKEEFIVYANQNSVNLTFDCENCHINGNKDMIKELVENLVQNAIRYNNNDGNVNVSIKKIDGRPVLIVKDNGIGIPDQDQQRIFERFYRVDKSRSKATGGTGLGLAIVKHIVEIHGAKIELNSKLGVGTTIKIKF